MMVGICLAVVTTCAVTGVRRWVSQMMRIGQYRPHTNHNGRIAMPLFLHMVSGGFSGNPFGCTRVGSDFSIQRHGIFHHHKGTSGLYIVKKYFIQFLAVFLKNAYRYLNTMGPQDLNSFSADQRIGIIRANNDPLNAGFQNGVRTGRLSAVMAAGFQCDIHRRTLRRKFTGSQRIALCMGLPVFFMPALTDDFSVLYDNSANHRIWRNPSAALLGNLQS